MPFIVKYAVAAAIMAFAACEPDSLSEAVAQNRPLTFEQYMELTAPAALGVVPHATVRIKSARWACPAKEDVWAVLENQDQGNSAAADHIIFSRCMASYRFAIGQTFTVVARRGALAQISTKTVKRQALANRGGYAEKTFWIPAYWLASV